MKKCFKCVRDLPLSEFYTHPKMADGHLGKCKDCTRLYMKKTRKENPDEHRQRDRDRFHGDPRRRSAVYASVASWKTRNPEKRKAQNAVSHAIRDKRLSKQSCEVCGAQRAEAHHDDYSLPLNVRWLCKDHHVAAHHPF